MDLRRSKLYEWCLANTDDRETDTTSVTWIDKPTNENKYEKTYPWMSSPDTTTWQRNSLHIFSTTSIYAFIVKTPYIQTTYRNMWSIHAPLNVIIFLWLMLQNRMLTIDYLIKRGWIMSNICYRHRSASESIAHVFHECAFIIKKNIYI
jgi:zinc-binding in reverse transcriptase